MAQALIPKESKTQCDNFQFIASQLQYTLQYILDDTQRNLLIDKSSASPPDGGQCPLAYTVTPDQL